MFHEASICNLIECLLFHQEALDSGDDTLAELVDYCYHQLAWLIDTMEKDPHFMAPKDVMTEFKNHTRQSELEGQIREIRFKCAMSCLSIIRFIAEYIDKLPTSVTY